MITHNQRDTRIGSRFAVFRFLAQLALALAIVSPIQAQTPTFNTVVLTGTGSPPWMQLRPAAIGDFNGDGRRDAMIVDGSPTVAFMRGSGTGTFSLTQINAVPMTVSNMVGLPANLAPFLPLGIGGYGLNKAGDFNGDGKLDLVCTTTVHINWAPYSLVTVLTNTGNDAGGNPQFSTLNYFLGFYDVRSLSVGELTGDNRPDIIVGSAYAGLYIYQNDGTGLFTRSQVTSIMPNAGGPAVGPGVIADLNGDGRGDFVVTSFQSNSTNVFLGNGDGTLQAPSIVSGPTAGLAVADLDNDGRPEILQSTSNGSIAVYPGNGNGTFGTPATFPTTAATGANGLFVSDVNGDGRLDVAASLQSISKVAILTGNGNGTLNAPVLFGNIPSMADVTLADFTGDTKPEIASVSAAGYGGQNFALLTNTTPAALPTRTLTILGGTGAYGTPAPNVEYFNPVTNTWQGAYLVGTHPWGQVSGTDNWVNYKLDNVSDADAGPTPNQTKWYLYRVRFTVPSDAVNPKMTFSLKADNFAQVAINGSLAGGSTQFINNANVPNVVVGTADQVNADAVFSQAVRVGENTITLNIGDWGGLNGFNFRIDLSMQSSEPLALVPAVPPDSTPPVISAPPSVTAEATSAAGAVVTYAVSANDNVDGNVPVSAAPASGSTFALGTTPVGLAASDSAGNTATASFDVTVRDTTAPAITSAANVGPIEATGPTGAAVSFAVPTASDLVDGSVAVTASPASGATFALGTSTVSLASTDSRGNAASGSFTVLVVDTTAPAIGTAADVTAEATSAAGATVSFATPTASDLVDGNVAVAAAPASGSVFPLGATPVTLSAADSRGNAASSTFTVRVVDTTAPVINAPGNIVAEATSAAGAAVAYAASASDLVDGNVVVSGSPASGSTFALGTTPVVLSASDSRGNTADASFTVTVRDTIAPTLVVPANQVLEATSAAGAVATFTATAQDAVGVASLTSSAASGSTFPIGTTTVSVTARDAAGNATSGSFTITVRDTTAPRITSLSASPAVLWPANHKMVNVTLTPIASDAVGVTSLKIVSVTSSEPDNGCGDGDTPNDIQITGNLTLKLRAERDGRRTGRTYTIVVEARDAAGNATRSTVTVSVPKSQGKNDKDDDDDDDDRDDRDDKKDKDDKKGKDDKKDSKGKSGRD